MQQKFLQKALNYYQKFAGDTSTDANVRLKTAVANRRVAEIQEKLGHYSEAESACRRATTILERLAAERPSYPQYECEFANIENTLARLLSATGPQEEADRLTRQTIARLEKLAAEAPSVREYRYELARTNLLVGRFLWKTDLPGSERALLRAVALLEKLAVDSFSVPNTGFRWPKRTLD